MPLLRWSGGTTKPALQICVRCGEERREVGQSVTVKAKDGSYMG